ncbi:MAG: HAD-IC family P-type ATPase [Parcubacteria group bacterium]|nr:HAD-IC family P-type ATPase [Parcubacteria group bacterium]
MNSALGRTQWHALSWQETERKLATNVLVGLTEEGVEKRRRQSGENKLPEEKLPSQAVVFLRQFKNPLILILLGAVIITLFLREYTNTLVITAALLLNALISHVQEYRAQKALSKLRGVLQFKARVIRAGHEKEIFQKELVPGDILFLTPGNTIAADARVIESVGLQVNEAVLTGEWIASPKTPQPVPAGASLADRNCMVYMGTVAEEGNGKAIVVEIGLRTELGHIASSLREITEEKTPYQRKLAAFSWVISGMVAVAAALLFLQGIFTNQNPADMFLIAVAVAVAAVPEGLPLAITVVLALGMQKILRKKGLVRRLTAAETLGSATVIATDKTLTLTEGRMEVGEIFSIRGDHQSVLVIAALANEAFVENPEAMFEKRVVVGRPTERALLEAAMEAGLLKDQLEKQYPLVLRIPFTHQEKYVGSLHKKDGRLFMYVSGAPDALLEISAGTKKEKDELDAKIRELAGKGLRVIGFALKEFKASELGREAIKAAKEEIRNLTFAGLIGLKDPIRKGVEGAIASAKQAGIRTIIVTGDHLLTAQAVAREINIPATDDNCIEGKELERLSDEQLQKRLDDLFVYARVEPSHKLRIVEAWQARGEVIAMTGDGVNDSPALKKADIGIALGSGTDIAKEVADLVLLGDDFKIIPAAIREGRGIVDNIRKVITYLLSGSFTEVILIGSSLALGLPLPITALQILWINVIGDGPPALALAFEKTDENVMQRKPEKKRSSLLTLEMRVIIFIIGIVTDILLLLLFVWFWKYQVVSLEHVRTLVFIGLGINSLFFVFSCKNLRKNIWQYNVLDNRFLTLSVFIGIALFVLPVYVPFTQNILGLAPLRIFDWMLLAGLGVANIALIELAKWGFIKKTRA